KRYCIWIQDGDSEAALSVPQISVRIARVREFRLSSAKEATRQAAAWPHRFDERKSMPMSPFLCVPITTSANREYLPADVLPGGIAISNLAFGMSRYEAWVFGIVVSRLM